MTTAIVFVLGVILGSFVNAFVWRLRILENPNEVKLTEVKKPSQVKSSKKTVLKSEARRAALKAEYSITKGRSMCPHCRHLLAAKDLVPVASWLSLRGKCRYCQKAISRQYPAVELLTGALFALSYWAWPGLLAGLGWLLFGMWLVFVVFFVALAVYDFHWYELPDRVVWPLTALAVLYAVLRAVIGHDVGLLWGAVFGAAIVFGMFWVIFQVTAGRAIGGGDVKLGLTLGLLAGSPLKALLLIFAASFIGTAVCLPMLLMKGRSVKTLVPFGPFLIAGAFLVVLWGDLFVQTWLNKLILP